MIQSPEGNMQLNFQHHHMAAPRPNLKRIEEHPELEERADYFFKKFKSFLRAETRPDLIILLINLDEILTATKYIRPRSLLQEEYDTYLTAIESAERGFQKLTEYSRSSNIETIKGYLKSEQAIFLSCMKRRKAREKNFAAYVAAAHIAFFLKDSLGLKKFAYYQKTDGDCKIHNYTTAFVVELFKQYGEVDGADCALKYMKIHFDKIDQNFLKLEEFL